MLPAFTSRASAFDRALNNANLLNALNAAGGLPALLTFFLAQIEIFDGSTFPSQCTIFGLDYSNVILGTWKSDELFIVFRVKFH